MQKAKMQSEQPTSIISRAHSLLTADAMHPDQPAGSRTAAAHATDLAKDVRGELGAWWNKNKVGFYSWTEAMRLGFD